MLPVIIVKYKRKSTIAQAQLTDYISGVKVEVYRSWVPKEYNAARKKFRAWLPVRPRSRGVAPPPPGMGRQGTFDRHPNNPATKPTSFLLFWRLERVL